MQSAASAACIPGSCGGHREYCQSRHIQSCPAENSQNVRRHTEAAGALPKSGCGFLQNAFLDWTCTCVWVAQLSESFCHFRGVNVKLEFLRSIYAGNTEDARGRPATD